MHDLASRLPVTDNEDVGDLVGELKAAVQAAVAAARASQAQADADHERAKEVLIQARLQTAHLPLKDRLGPKVLEQLTGSYLDRDTISRITSPPLAAQERKRHAA